MYKIAENLQIAQKHSCAKMSLTTERKREDFFINLKKYPSEW